MYTPRDTSTRIESARYSPLPSLSQPCGECPPIVRRSASRKMYEKTLASRDPWSFKLGKLHSAELLAPLEKGSKEGNHVHRHETGNAVWDSTLAIGQSLMNPRTDPSRVIIIMYSDPPRVSVFSYLARMYVCVRVCVYLRVCRVRIRVVSSQDLQST